MFLDFIKNWINLQTRIICGTARFPEHPNIETISNLAGNVLCRFLVDFWDFQVKIVLGEYRIQEVKDSLDIFEIIKG